MLIKLGFWTPVLFFLTLKSGFPETSSQLTPSSSEESCKPSVPRGRLSQSGTRSSNPASSASESVSAVKREAAYTEARGFRRGLPGERDARRDGLAMTRPPLPFFSRALMQSHFVKARMVCSDGTPRWDGDLVDHSARAVQLTSSLPPGARVWLA